MKTETSTLDRLPISKTNGLYRFSIPEEIDRHGLKLKKNHTFHLLPDHVDGTEVLVVVPDGDIEKLKGLKHKAMFWKMKDNN